MTEPIKSQSVLDLLSFRWMITPTFIQIIFWIGVIVVVIYGISTIVEGINGGPAGRAMAQMQSQLGQLGGGGEAMRSHADGGEIFSGFLMLILGPIAWRIYCELLIVIFKIHSELTGIRSDMRSAAPAAGGFPVTGTPR